MTALISTLPNKIERDSNGHYRLTYRGNDPTKYVVVYAPNNYTNAWHAASFSTAHDESGTLIAVSVDSVRPLEPDEIDHFKGLVAGL